MDINIKENGVLVFNDLKVDTYTHQAWRGEREIYFSGKEYELMILFLKNPRRILNKQYLYEQAWQKTFLGQSNILEVYINYLRTKLELLHEPQIIFTVRGYGYILR